MHEINVNSRSRTTQGTVMGYKQAPYHLYDYEIHNYLIAYSDEFERANMYDSIEEYETVCARQCPECGMIELYSKVRRKTK